MARVNMREMLATAARERYGVGAFNILDFNTMWATVQAAEECRAPVIIQTSVKTVKLYGHDSVISWYNTLAEEASVPVAIHLDHCKEVDFIRRCIDAGWTSVMIDASSYPFERNLEMTQQVVEMARPHDVSVEGELGEIGGVEDDISVDMTEARYADPDKAKQFLNTVKVDVFAPNIGTAHGVYKGEPKVAFDLVERIYRENGVPLALHGGTGLSEETFKRCIAGGCAKVNISTNLKYVYIESFDEYRKQHAEDYEPIRLIAHQIEAAKNMIKDKIRLFGGEGKA